MKQEVKEIPFNGSTLLGIRDENGQVWLAVKKACLDIGLSEGQAQRQITNIQKDLVFCEGVANLQFLSNGGKQKTTCVKEKFVTLWLAKISLTPSMQKKNPEAVQKLLTYQLEAADVLHKAFYETEEQKSTFNARMGLEGRIEGMQIQINNMENMMCEQMEKLDSVIDNMTLSTRQQQKLLTYQLEAADVLHKAFYETEEQKSTFNARMGLEGRIEGMQIQINNMENMMCEQMEKLDSVIDNMTLSTRQQQKLYKAAKDRINHLLGGAHSPEYKENAKSYFINLWNGLKALYGCASYKDLNPKYYDVAFDYISEWEYVEA